MYGNYKDFLSEELKTIEQNGLFKRERVITTKQGATVKVNGKEVIIFCANNYLGLSSHPKVIEAAHKTLDTHGYGMSSVRFICGTQDIHKTLEEKIAKFHSTEDTILYAACFDANGGVFEPLFGENDAIISDELNHASIIDGVRLTKSVRYRYKNCDMNDLEAKLKESQAQKFRIIVTDGVFSMDGFVAPIDKICALAEKYNALVMVDESHATGFIGKTGRGAKLALRESGHPIDAWENSDVWSFNYDGDTFLKLLSDGQWTNPRGIPLKLIGSLPADLYLAGVVEWGQDFRREADKLPLVKKEIVDQSQPN